VWSFETVEKAQESLARREATRQLSKLIRQEHGSITQDYEASIQTTEGRILLPSPIPRRRDVLVFSASQPLGGFSFPIRLPDFLTSFTLAEEYLGDYTSNEVPGYTTTYSFNRQDGLVVSQHLAGPDIEEIAEKEYENYGIPEWTNTQQWGYLAQLAASARKREPLWRAA
jgi:hypothetical protein